MRILYVHERCGSLGGAEASVLITGRELAARGHEVGLLHGPATGRGEERWNQVFSSQFLLDENDPGATVEEALRQFRPDVVYLHKLADLRVIEILAELPQPVVRMVHDHDIYCMRSYRYSYLSRKICTRAASPYCVYGCGAFLTRRRGPGFPLQFNSYGEKKREITLNQRLDRMIVVSHYMREELLRNGFDPEKIEIHGPVPPPGDPELRSSFSDRNLIVYAGQIIRGKGVDVLLRALAQVRVPFECIILGDGNQRAVCERLARRLGLADRVSFAGFIPQEDLKQHYREASVVAVSSVWAEPIATIGLEVMRYALPVVAFDAGGIRDWLIDGHNGFLVPWMDTTAYARAVERVLRDKELARSMGQNGFALVSERYDFDGYIHDLENLFESLVAKRRAAPQSEAAPA